MKEFWYGFYNVMSERIEFPYLGERFVGFMLTLSLCAWSIVAVCEAVFELIKK